MSAPPPPDPVAAPPRVIERRADGWLVITVPAEAPCPDCTPGLTRLNWRKTGLASCSRHAESMRFVDAVRNTEVTLYAPLRPESDLDADLLNATAALRSDTNGKYYLMEAVADLPGWGIDENGPDDAAAAQVARMALWVGRGYTAEMVRAHREVGIDDPDVAQSWVGFFGALERFAAWARAGYSPEDAADWHRAGQRPDTIPAGHDSVEAWAFAKKVGAEDSPEWGALWDEVNTSFAHAGREAGHSPQAVLALGVAFVASDEEQAHPPALDGLRWREGGLVLAERWGAGTDQRALRLVDAVGPLDWEAVALCLNAGMSSAEAVQYVQDERDLAPVQVMAGLRTAGGQ